MRVRKIILFLSLIVYIPCFTQTIVKGVVVDNNNVPISNVNIKVKRFSLQATSDSIGKFEIFVPPNKFLELKKEGFFTKSLKITKNLELPITFRLRKKQPTDNTVLVKGTLIDYNYKTPLIGASVFSQELASQTLSDINGQFELEVRLGSTILVSYGRTESFLIEYGGEQIFEIFKPAPTPTIGNHTTITKENFNRGNIHHPLQLIQTRSPGLLMSMGGGNNPFGRYNTRIHGLSSFNGEQPWSNTIFSTVDPLIVVDGVPDTDISILDPLSIQSIKVIKDGTAAQYGIRGASGVLEITTNKATSSGIQYHTYLGVDRLYQTMQFLDAKSYRGDVQNHQTDWFKEVSRKAFTHTHHISMSKKQPSTSYRLSLLFKDAEGILKKQGYQRLQANGYLQHSAFDEKLTITALLRSSVQDNNYSQPLAFRYAQSYNPTSPILDQNSQYGGYFEGALFDYYNPVAMLNLHTDQGNQKQLFTKLSTQYKLLPFLQLTGEYSRENYQISGASYTSKNSFWRGSHRNGIATKSNRESSNQFFNTHLELTPVTSSLKNITIGHQYQLQQNQSFHIEGGDFLTDAFDFNNFAAAGDFAKGLGTINSNKSKHRLSAFYVHTQFNWDNLFLLNTGLRIEGSSRLGNKNRWGRFPYVAIASNLGNSPDSFWRKNNIQLRASFGITGNLPYTDYLGLRRYGPNGSFYYNGEFISSYGITYDNNSYLSWEKKKEWNIGVNLQPVLFNKKISLSAEVYTNKITGILQQLQNRLGRNFFGNIGRIRNRGIEISLETELLRKQNLSWQTSVVLSSNNSILENYAGSNGSYLFGYPHQRSPNFPIAGGCCKVNSVLIEDGSTIGDLFFLEMEGISSDGKWIFADVDKNGMRDDVKDKTVVGNGLPDWVVGWNNTFRLGSFKVDLFFRGALGHDLFNITRKLTENPGVIQTYNVLASTFEGESARLTDFPKESSYYIENATFLRLDNLQIAYQLTNPKKLPFTSLQFYVAANNVFTISGYKGWDPDFRLQNENDVLSIGYEFRNLYLPSKSWVFGIQLGIK